MLNTNSQFHSFDDVVLFREMSDEVAVHAAGLVGLSHGQLRQDIFAAAANGFKRGGFFVEIGATDGIYLSNTNLLEKSFEWSGILAEPATYWHDALFKNRDAIIDTRCVHSESGVDFLFREVSEDQGLSTLVNYAAGDLHKSTRETGKDYAVESISLTDLLALYGAPREIEFMSLDTEGSEFDILRTFDFEAFRFNVICCEHNYVGARADILELLKKNGYIRVLNKITKFDDWFIHESYIDSFSQAFPRWDQQSTQCPDDNKPVWTENEQQIGALRDTIEMLIADRDSHKKHVDLLLHRISEVDEARIQQLVDTINSLIVDRDAHKEHVEILLGRKDNNSK